MFDLISRVKSDQMIISGHILGFMTNRTYQIIAKLVLI